jgi:hypothetical protein
MGHLLLFTMNSQAPTMLFPATVNTEAVAISHFIIIITGIIFIHVL